LATLFLSLPALRLFGLATLFVSLPALRLFGLATGRVRIPAHLSKLGGDSLLLQYQNITDEQRKDQRNPKNLRMHG
jgi:hypothetical protein